MPFLQSSCVVDPAESRRELGYRLHLFGLTGSGDEVPPSYRRAEEALRRAARVPFPRDEVLPKSLSEALTGAVDPRDLPWFERRAQAGEAAEVQRAEVSLVEAVQTLWPDGAPELPVATLVVSPALRPLPLISAGGEGARPLILAGPDASPEILLLAALVLPHAARLETGYLASVRDVTPAARRFATLMVGGSLLHYREPPSALLDQVLKTVVQEVLPPQHRGDEVARWINSMASCLDQPPGEIERTIHGLARRRADRVHRAWVRRFFVPRGDLLAGA
jgi:hypothetical protein